ncbi:MAG TPA: glutamate 5-kinase [Candidatus Acidoferrales bacterium]|nr:glutamate 5-kinase [Candidatus Acidoferrales bacterium]
MPPAGQGLPAASDRNALLKNTRRVVVKVGTAVVCDRNGEFDLQRVRALADGIAGLVKHGRQVVVVSSGAVTLGAAQLKLHRSRLRDAAMTRACAAVGQCKLMQAWAEALQPNRLTPAQVLVTEDDFTDLNRYRILRQTFEKLLKVGSVPVVNENDTVTNIWTEQPAIFRDNDRLAALVLSKLDADLLILLSNVEGLLRDPERGAEPDNVIPLVTVLSPEIRESAQGKSAVGRGGMTAKLDAAQIAMHAGGMVIIANGQTPGILNQIFSGENVGTMFLPGSRMTGKKRWLAFATSARGRVSINANAAKAILHGHASLLISGVTGCKGEFSSGQVISVVDADGRAIGRGIAECGSQELSQMLSSNDGPLRGVLVRRDNFIILSGEEKGNGQQD